MKNKILILVAVFIFAVTFLAGGKTCAAAAVISAGTASGNPGDANIEIPISLTTSPKASAVFFNLTYNPSILTLNLNDITLGTGASGLALEKVIQNSDTAGTVSFFLAEYPADPTGIIPGASNVIFKVKFAIKAGAASGDTPISISDAAVVNSGSTEISSTASNGKITVNGLDGVSYNVLKASASPTIDGDLSEYQNANSIDLTTTGGNVATVKSLWNSEALYIAADVIDIQLSASATQRDGAVWSDDSIEWAIDTQNNKGGATTPNSAYMLADDYHGIVNILNTVYDSQGSAGGAAQGSWNGVWTSAVLTTATGYAVEIKIPWTVINNHTPAENQIVGMGFNLNDKDGTAISNKVWPADKGIAFENASNWNEVRLSAVPAPARKYLIADFKKLVVDWLKTNVPTSLADVFQDGTINTRDLGVMMSNWQN